MNRVLLNKYLTNLYLFHDGRKHRFDSHMSPYSLYQTCPECRECHRKSLTIRQDSHTSLTHGHMLHCSGTGTHSHSSSHRSPAHSFEYKCPQPSQESRYTVQSQSYSEPHSYTDSTHCNCCQRCRGGRAGGSGSQRSQACKDRYPARGGTSLCC